MMMKTRNFLWLVITLIVITACEKDEFPKQQNVENPTFFADGKIGGSNFSFTAGEKDYYMYTWYQKDTYDVYSFVGEFRKTDGTGEKLSFKIRNSSETSVNIENALATGTYPYTGPINPIVQNAFDVQFYSESTGAKPHASYSWAFGDGTYSNQENPFHRFDTSSQTAFDVTLSIAYGDNCSSSATNIVKFDGSCGASFNYSTLTPSPNIIAFTPIAWGAPPFTYEWDFGNGQTSTDSLPAVYYTYNEVYPVNLKVTDANHCEATYQRNVRVATNCVANFSYTSSPVITIDSIQLSHVEITYTAKDGTVYTSTSKTQPSNMDFFLADAYDFEDNENGEKVKRVDAFYDARLFNINNPNDYIDITKARASFGVAYPQ